MNRADDSLGYKKIISSKVKKCVFISYKKEDSNVAKEVGKFLEEQLGIDIYLDIFDLDLKEVISVENDKKIVSSIKKV